MKGFARLKADIKGKNPARFYLFHGEEDYLREQYLQRLKTLLVEPELEGFNFSQFEGKMASAEEVFSAVDTLPLLSERKLVVWRDVDIYKGDNRAYFEEWLPKLPESCCFVVDTSGYKPDGRTKLAKLVETHGVTVEFDRLSHSDLLRWVARRFAALNKSIRPDEAEYLVFLCGASMTNLIGEIEKIGALALGDEIAKADIDAVAVPVLEAVVYEMTDALAARQYAKAIGLLRALFLQREEPIALLGAMGRTVRGLYLAKLVNRAGHSSRTVMEAMGYRSAYPAQKLMSAAERFSLDWCRSAVHACFDCDLALKTSSQDKEAVLETLLLRLCQTAGSNQ